MFRGKNSLNKSNCVIKMPNKVPQIMSKIRINTDVLSGLRMRRMEFEGRLERHCGTKSGGPIWTPHSNGRSTPMDSGHVKFTRVASWTKRRGLFSGNDPVRFLKKEAVVKTPAERSSVRSSLRLLSAAFDYPIGEDDVSSLWEGRFPFVADPILLGMVAFVNPERKYDQEIVERTITVHEKKELLAKKRFPVFLGKEEQDLHHYKKVAPYPIAVHDLIHEYIIRKTDDSYLTDSLTFYDALEGAQAKFGFKQESFLEALDQCLNVDPEVHFGFHPDLILQAARILDLSDEKIRALLANFEVSFPKNKSGQRLLEGIRYIRKNCDDGDSIMTRSY